MTIRKYVEWIDLRRFVLPSLQCLQLFEEEKRRRRKKKEKKEKKNKERKRRQQTMSCTLVLTALVVRETKGLAEERCRIVRPTGLQLLKKLIA